MRALIDLTAEEQAAALKAAMRAGYPSIGAWCLAMVREKLAQAARGKR